MENKGKALAFLETDGRAGIIAALDIMPKMANVSFVRIIRLGRGIMAVVFEGDVGAARAAQQAGQLPTHDEAGHGTNDGGGSQRDQGAACRPPRRCGNGSPREADIGLDSAEYLASQ